MNRRPPRRMTVAVTAGGLALAVAACGDSRVEKLSEGISRDSALAILAEGATPGDSLTNVYKQETYLLNGKLVNVLFYNRKGVTQAQDSSVKATNLTPVVVADGKVAGWGWAYYDSVAKANNIQVMPR